MQRRLGLEVFWFAIGYVELCCISSAGLNALFNGLFAMSSLVMLLQIFELS